MPNMSNMHPNTTRVSYNPDRPQCMTWCSGVFFVKTLLESKKRTSALAMQL